ncbi:sterol o-acyltransferase [Anaeramoeba flamelloides]|uniref:Sterol o-acyltransferase n=1 Tax=Anaeramoeba flamelloides TaxID=1746091 RepID=A0AAV8ACU3_9EUKA|nr:sterol o-acyltransferase [Anaeramoeba flamelloides]
MNKKIRNNSINSMSEKENDPHPHWVEQAPLSKLSFKTFNSIFGGLYLIIILAILQQVVNYFMGNKCFYSMPDIRRLPLAFEDVPRLFVNFAVIALSVSYTPYVKRQYLLGKMNRKRAKQILWIMLLLVPNLTFLLRTKKINVWVGFFTAAFNMAATFKCWSYIRSLFDEEDKAKGEKQMRKIRSDHKRENTLAKFLFFLMRPWVVYEVNYPKTAKRNYLLAAKYFAGAFLSITCMLGVLQVGFQKVYTTDQVWKDFVPTMMCLGLPSIFFWVLLFITFFHFYLSSIAEITQYKPRGLYGYWWDVLTIQDFWKHWNPPINQWAARYIYRPLRKRGVSRDMAGIAVFIVSGILHEYLLWGMFGSWNFWVSLIFFGQPIIMFIEKKLSTKLLKIMAEIIKIITFFGGLSFITIMYGRKWLQKTNDNTHFFDLLSSRSQIFKNHFTQEISIYFPLEFQILTILEDSVYNNKQNTLNFLQKFLKNPNPNEQLNYKNKVTLTKEPLNTEGKPHYLTVNEDLFQEKLDNFKYLIFHYLFSSTIIYFNEDTDLIQQNIYKIKTTLSPIASNEQMNNLFPSSFVKPNLIIIFLNKEKKGNIQTQELDEFFSQVETLYNPTKDELNEMVLKYLNEPNLRTPSKNFANELDEFVKKINRLTISSRKDDFVSAIDIRCENFLKEKEKDTYPPHILNEICEKEKKSLNELQKFHNDPNNLSQEDKIENILICEKRIDKMIVRNKITAEQIESLFETDINNAMEQTSYGICKNIGNSNDEMRIYFNTKYYKQIFPVYQVSCFNKILLNNIDTISQSFFDSEEEPCNEDSNKIDNTVQEHIDNKSIRNYINMDSINKLKSELTTKIAQECKKINPPKAPNPPIILLILTLIQDNIKYVSISIVVLLVTLIILFIKRA